MLVFSRWSLILVWASVCLGASSRASSIHLQRAYFPGGFPEVNFETVADCCLPICEDLSGKDTCCSFADLQKIPFQVAEWTHFAQKVRDYRKGLPDILLKKVISTGDLSFGNSVAYDEKDLTRDFVSHAGSRLNQMFGKAIITRGKASPAVEIGEGLRQPDFLMERVAGMDLIIHSIITKTVYQQSDDLEDFFLPSSEKFTYPANVALAAGETKRRNFNLRGKAGITRGDDLVKRYNEKDRQVVDAIYQMTGYQVHYGCKFGFLTTYGKTWATCLSPKGVLYVSPAYSSDTNGHDSLLNMMYFVLSLSANQLGSGKNLFDLPTNLSSPDLSYGPGSIKDKVVRALKWSSRDLRLHSIREASVSSRGVLNLRYVRQLVSHLKRVTCQASVLDSNNTFVAVKCYEASEDRDNEVACYNALHCLQGHCIPKLLVANCSIPWDENRTHGLVLSWMGKQFGGNYMSLPKRALLQARAIMHQMHKRGVVHRDLRPENMNYNFDSNKLYIYDFSEARTLLMLGLARFQEACREDCEVMEELVESAEAFEESGGRFRGDLPPRVAVPLRYVTAASAASAVVPYPHGNLSAEIA